MPFLLTVNRETDDFPSWNMIDTPPLPPSTNPFIPKSDQFQIPPAASPEM